MNINKLSKKTNIWAKEISEIAAVILFGSRAKGTENADSDWDICCLINEIKNGGYGAWVHNADDWKNSFCASTGLDSESVQFTTTTSNQVVSGLLEISRVLYVQQPHNT